MSRVLRAALVGVLLWLAACAPSSAPAPASTATPPPLTGSPAASPAASPSPATRPSASPLPSPVASPSPAANFPVTLVDDLGRTVRVESTPRRIVTLQPSATEIVCALDACDRVVATDNFSNYPPEVLQRPKLGDLKMSAEAVIDQRPDLVITAYGSPADLLTQIEKTGIPILLTNATNLEGVYANVDLVARALGTTEAGARVVGQMRQRVSAVTTRVAGAPRPKVFFEVDATDPARPFSIGPGTFIDELIGLAGGQNILANSPTPYPQVSAEQIVAADPDVIVLGDGAFGVRPADVAARPGWSGITAVKNGAIRDIDPDPISRPGPRLAQGLEDLARVLHPERFQ